MNLTLYLGVVFGGALAVTIVLLLARIAHWRTLAIERRGAYEELMERTQAAEAEVVRGLQNYQALEHTVNGLLSRPIVAQLSDAQANAFIQHIIGWLSTSQSDPSKLS